MDSPFAIGSLREPGAGAGQRIGRYRLVRPLSKGGMALVYEGRRESLAGVSPRVAIKLILPEHASSETFKELFINEARLGASMQHQNLVQIQDFDCDGDTYFLAMEYVEGLTLRKMITLADRARIRIPLGVIAELGRQSCDGLDYAHTARDERGRPLHLVHRDIKPSNLILNPQGVVKVLDFGISKGRLREERKGSVKGTWGYMAPEQAMGADVGPTADVFGLAVVLYELASLRPMFLDQPKDEVRRLLKEDHAARMAATLDAAAFGPLIGVLVRALQRDPAARFEDAASFGRALSALLTDPITARDEVVRLYGKLDALDRGSRLPPQRPAGGEAVGRPDNAESGGPPLSLAGAAPFVGGAAIALVLAAAVVVGAVSALDERGAAGANASPDPAALASAERPAVPMCEPSGPAGDGAPGEQVRCASPTERPPPLDSPSVDVRAGRAAAAVPEPTDEPASTEGKGVLHLEARQPAEVYVDGRFVATTPFDEALPPGRHTINLVASDGRRHAFEVEVQVDERIDKVWDFDRVDWR